MHPPDLASPPQTAETIAVQKVCGSHITSVTIYIGFFGEQKLPEQPLDYGKQTRICFTH